MDTNSKLVIAVLKLIHEVLYGRKDILVIERDILSYDTFNNFVALYLQDVRILCW